LAGQQGLSSGCAARKFNAFSSLAVLAYIALWILMPNE
jgi:phage shock protein PspC (stress-responsive transcriptional regulator)